MLKLTRMSPVTPPGGACPLQVRTMSATFSAKPSGRIEEPTVLAEHELPDKPAGSWLMTYAKPAIVTVPDCGVEPEFAPTV